MFKKEVYINRRTKLREELTSGLVLMLGNNETAMNYSANPYHFRQDSTFLYFFGLDHAGLAGIIDVDNNIDYLFGEDVDLDDIIWMGPQPSLKARAEEVGVMNTLPFGKIQEFLLNAIAAGRKIHFTPPYRAENTLLIEKLVGIHHSKVKQHASVELIKAVVKMRSVKDKYEIAEIERAVATAYLMHTTSMKMAKPGIIEQEIVGVIEGIASSHGGPTSFPVILSINGQTLHNHYHGNVLQKGRMMVTDAGAETALHYASDITRTVPVGGKFDQRQKDIYQIVLNANTATIEASKPGVLNRDLHLLAAKIIATGLKDLGLMKGDIDAAVKAGAHALFFPHGLGHMMGLDVHDMEDLGENYIGYTDTILRSDQFGLAFLRLARPLETGFVFTIEPGCYFIPAMIDKWYAEKKFTEFINYEKVESFKDFGGIRIEDDVLITETGHRVLGKPIPKTISEIEETMNM